MCRRFVELLAFPTLLTIAAPAIAQCTEQDFGQYQLFGQYQQAQARIPDGQLLAIFAGHVGVPKRDFGELVKRCAAHARTASPDEAKAALAAAKPAFLADCAKRPAADEVCKAVRGR